MGYGRIHEHGYPINHRFRMVGSSLFELYVPAPSWLVPCMQFDEEQKRANRKWEGDCYSYTYAVWCWLVYFKGLWSAVYASVYINSTRNWGLYWKKEREPAAKQKPGAVQLFMTRTDDTANNVTMLCFASIEEKPWKSSSNACCHQYAYFFLGFKRI